jgi:hypothetical protein
METIWLLAGHLAGQGPQGGQLRFPGEQGWPDTLKDTTFPWDLELLARETILNSPTMGGDKSLGRWGDFARAINFIRDIDNEISRRSGGEDILRQLHRIIHRQFPWQRPPTATSIMRYYKIFGGSELEPAVEKETGLPIRKFYQLAFALAGHFLKSAGVDMATDYSAIGVSKEESVAFFEKMSTTLPGLREQTRSLQSYDDGWLYAWNPLQARPLVAFDPSYPERAYCPIPMYMLRRASDGLFYDLVKTPGFDNAYGAAFQNYVGTVLRLILKPPKFEVVAETPYNLGKAYRKHGVDWTVMDETANLFVECKTKRLRQDAKFVLAGSGLADAMDALGSYVVQHYKNITDALAGKTAWLPNEKPSFAIIVTLEDWWIFMPPIVSMLDESVARHLAEAGIDRSILERVPFAIASIDELEIGSQIMAETGIQPFLGMKSDAEHRGWSMSPFYMAKFPEQAARAHRRLFADEFFSFGSGLAKAVK